MSLRGNSQLNNQLAVIPKEDSYDISIDLTDAGSGFARAQTDAVDTILAIDRTVSVVEQQLVNWLSKQLEKGAKIVGNAVYDAAGNLLKKTSNKIIQLAEDKMVPKKGRTNAPVPKIQPKKQQVAPQRLMTNVIAPVSAPAATSNVLRRRGQPATSTIRRGVLIKHTEMLNVLTSSATASAYKVTPYVINPAKADVFPWLSSVAANYDKYRIRRMTVMLNSMQATSVAGKYGVGYDPDSTDEPPADRSELYSTYKHVEGPVWNSLSLNLPVSGKELFCNSHTGGDSKLIDDGQIVIFSDLITATSSPLADIIVDYEIELLDPQQALFSTNTSDCTGLTYTTTTLVVPVRVAGPKLYNLQISSATIMNMVCSPGYYRATFFLYDVGAVTPVITFTNNTSNTMYGAKLSSTTTFLATIIFKVTSSSYVVATNTIVGDNVGLTVSGVANWLALERYEITVSRVAAPTYGSLITTNYTSAATGGSTI